MEATSVKLTKNQFKACVDEAISRPKGTFRINDCEYINVRVRPEDCFLQINLLRYGMREDYTQQILDSVPDEYRDHITGIRYAGFWGMAYELMFDEQAQVKWDAALRQTKENYDRMYHNL